jgi:hypothetical protein
MGTITDESGERAYCHPAATEGGPTCLERESVDGFWVDEFKLYTLDEEAWWEDLGGAAPKRSWWRRLLRRP